MWFVQNDRQPFYAFAFSQWALASILAQVPSVLVRRTGADTNPRRCRRRRAAEQGRIKGRCLSGDPCASVARGGSCPESGLPRYSPLCAPLPCKRRRARLLSTGPRASRSPIDLLAEPAASSPVPLLPLPRLSSLPSLSSRSSPPSPFGSQSLPLAILSFFIPEFYTVTSFTLLAEPQSRLLRHI